jgi:hypothetical protein
MAPARLERITVYPLKSFDALEVPQALVLLSGALQHDRQFALVDSSGRIVNAKREPRVHLLSVQLDPQRRLISMQPRDGKAAGTFHIDDDRSAVEDWFSQYFGFEVKLLEDQEQGFPDDTEAPGPTVLSSATIEELQNAFPQFPPDELRLRFRANLEVGGVPAFWEDRLFTGEASGVPFRIGNVRLTGVNPCQRCAVPARDPRSGASTPGFQKQFSDWRNRTLPDWAAAVRFDHFYRLSTNTRSADGVGGVLRIGDPVRIDGETTSCP